MSEVAVNIQTTISPIDNTILLQREYASTAAVESAVVTAKKSEKIIKSMSLAQRQLICQRAIEYFRSNRQQMAEEITRQMGRPISFTPLEIDGAVARAEYMLKISEAALQDIEIENSHHCKRFIKREPQGLVFVIAPWNYPYLTAVNSIFPAILAGNAVILKHSAQTPLCAEHFYNAFLEAGLPLGVLQTLNLRHDQVATLVADSRINFIVFTGSVSGGHSIVQAASANFSGLNLELGGKDAAYVRSDADLKACVEGLVDGAFFNSGQSCCGVERIYVQHTAYDDFVNRYCATVREYKLGDPLLSSTTLGPMVRPGAANFVRKQISAAIDQGASALIDNKSFGSDTGATAYIAPQVLVDVDHSMALMQHESFGPVVGIMPVRDDVQAVNLMNDSNYGLTASVWTQDLVAANAVLDNLQAGTCFMNRCDYLDPALAWSGVKNTGRGCSLSKFGFDQLTRPKSFYMRKSF